MGTTLTKPVLLDETGQDIVDKLDEIKTAIGSTGEFIPVMIKVTTPPTKTTYGAGETLDLTGMVVTLYASNGMTFDVTGDCTFSPANGATLTSQDTSVDVSYEWYKDSTVFTTTQDLTVKTLTSIAVTTPPTDTEYTVGDMLDLTGIVVTATYDDLSTAIVTNSCVFNPADGAILTSADTSVAISYTQAGVTKTTNQALSVASPVYGVEWDGTSSSAWSRTDSAVGFTDPVPYYSGMNSTPSSPFDNIQPWAGMIIVDDPNAGKLVKIPKFYWKWTFDGTKIKLQITSSPQPGFHISPAHADRGDGEGERDYVYAGRYKCASTNYKSVTGTTPKNNVSLADFRTAIHALGDDIWQQDLAMIWTLRMLYLVEFADWNSQAKIGGGCSQTTATSPAVYNMGATDSMPYHTGTTSNNIGATVYGENQYRFIEGLWSNVWTFIDGVYADLLDIKAIKNPADFSDTTKSVTLGQIVQANGTIKKWSHPAIQDFEYALFPAEIDSTLSYDVYSCDHGSYYGHEHASLIYGGNKTQNQQSGLFSFGFDNSLARASEYLGSRLMKLPSNT